MENFLSSQTRHSIAEALAEDIGAGDWTTRYCVDEGLIAEAHIVARQDGIIAGVEAAAEVFRQVGDVTFDVAVEAGARVGDGEVVARLSGRARDILSGERVALNLLARLSGVATLTRHFVETVQGTSAKITDTRKTTPLWRELERAATRAGGAVNHRFALDDMILIKENHIACAGSIGEAVRRARAGADNLRIEVETRNLDEVEKALAAGVDRIMLDNMSVGEARESVARVGSAQLHVETEASGGINLANVREFAETGVDFISVGALTHSAPALDLSLLLSTIMT